ncbi:MAG: aminotransferase class V-fold PLP-dependent enzyme, partial [Betaproteobacteria bacterium]|nr:aminotransferase class V-fold PLP-dependent enzyme [Betaproteobacteria bacterium]
ACELAAGRMSVLNRQLLSLRDRLERGLAELGAVLFGAAGVRVPNTSYFALKGIDGEVLVIELDKAGYAVAAGAACSSTSTEPSATLLAMGVAPEIARGAVRFSLGAGNTAEQVDEFLKALATIARRLRRLTAVAV